MKRRFFGKPRLELLEDRLPPGDLLNYLVPSSFILSSRISTDHAVLENPVRSSGARQSVLADIANSAGADLGSLALLSNIPSQYEAASADFRTAGVVSQGATPDSDMDTFAPWTGANPLLDTDSLADSALRPSGHSRWTGGTSINPPSGLEGSSNGFFGGVSATGEPINYISGVGQDKIGDGVANQTLVANAPLLNSGIVPGSIEDISRDGYVPPGWQPQPDNGGLRPDAPPPNMNNRAQQLYQQYLHSRMGGGLTAPNGEDPGTPGPYATTRADFNLGDITLPGTPGPVEIQAEVTYPTGLDGGPRPLVIFLHGRHVTCFQGSSSFLEWPCATGHQPIPSFQGYQYIADVLASDNYIVVSIGANGVNARDNGVNDLGAQWRAQLVQYHLDLWNTWSTTGGGPSGIGDAFIGKVDMTNIGTMGHSRGGEGVVKNYVYNASLGYPYGINAVFPLAPVDFNRPVITYANQATMIPYCDGDVSDLQGAHFFDDARFNNGAGDFGFNHLLTVDGANHNFFNTQWTPGIGPPGAVDEGLSSGTCGQTRLTAAQQRSVGIAYIVGFFRVYLGGEYQFLGYFVGDAPPPSVQTRDVISSYHFPGPSDYPYREDVNQLLTATDLTTNSLGGSVTQTGLTPYDLCGGQAPQPLHCLPGSGTNEPHTVVSARSSARGLSELRVGWNSPGASLTNTLPAGSTDVSSYYYLYFRAGVNYSDSRNPHGQAQDFTVTLTDGAGNSASTLVSYWSRALEYPTGTSSSVTPHMIVNSVGLPIYAFSGVDLTDIRSITFAFDQTSSGALLLADISFAWPI